VRRLTAAPVWQPAEAGSDSGKALAGELMAPLRPDVVDAIGHVLGNLFQRMQHLSDRVGEADPLLGDETRSAVQRLDDFMHVVLDYLSWRAVEPVALPAAQLVDALVQRLRLGLGGRACLEIESSPPAILSIDPALMAQACDSLVKSLAVLRPSADPAFVHLAVRTAQSPENFAGVAYAAIAVNFSKGLVSLAAEAEVHRAVAQRIVEIHGGRVQLRRATNGEVTWEMTLPCRV
jgi:hypothetical protein